MATSRDTTILVVDDLTHARKILIRFLERLNFENFIEASSGKEAIELLHEVNVDVVMCDLNLGDMKGIQVLEHLRGSPKIEKIPFIMITSDMAKAEFVEAVQKGVTDYILKPLSEKTIQDKIEKVLRQ